MNNNMAEYLFHRGENFHAYEYLGSFIKKNYTLFRVWLPDIKKVFVVGDFNEWQDSHEMTKINENGIYEIKIKEAKNFDCYKYKIITKDDRIIFKSDPYARHFETRPNTASKIYSGQEYKWKDEKFLKARKIPYNKALNIYELHLASWMQKEEGVYYDYRSLAKKISTYVVNMGYTHIELLPITEHPYDKSWGYQVTGFFAPTSRFGTPDDFKYFVDLCHQKGIGVIMDWVPGHFPKDEFGLYEFNGFPLYEYTDSLKMEHKLWGTRVFDFGRNEVISFLISSATYWIEEYHIDGLRVDAVSSMLYLNYQRNDGEWRPNIYGDIGNLEAVSFLRKLNQYIDKKYKTVMMIAEESTAWPKITKSPVEDGLGFNFKWNMGWMNDTLSYYKEDPMYRQYHHDKITFPMVYAFSENYILALSHDEVVHGKKSLLDKAYVNYEDKFSNLKVLYSYMYALPGKKLLFMGGEFGQFVEWNEEKSLEWFLLAYDNHKKLHNFVKKLNHVYKDNSPFWEDDNGWDGFRWHIVDDRANNIIAFSRIDKKGKEILAVFNFSGQDLKYKVGVDAKAKYKVLLSSDNKSFGGSGSRNYKITTHKKEYMNFDGYIEIKLKSFSAIYLEKI